jgi:succinoglycan biosynthesis transport protein ExoP
VSRLPKFTKPSTHREGKSVPPGDDSFQEAIRGLRETILARNSALVHKVILVTSAVSREGRTAIATSLARSFARRGASVLLITSGIRTARQDDVVPLENTHGLLEALVSGEYSTAFESIEGEPRLRVLPFGADLDKHVDLFANPNMSVLVKRLRTEFDFVIIDSPPLLTRVDSRLLSEISDATVFVLKARSTENNDVYTALSFLRRHSSADAIQPMFAALNFAL